MKAISSALVVLALFSVAACDTEDATTAVVDDDYSAADAVVVYKVWWSTALFSTPVVPGAESDSSRVVTDDATAYALLAPGWDPTSGAPPTYLVAVKSKATLSVARGDELHIRLSDSTMTGRCAAGGGLMQADADFITQRIFPGDFAGGTYDAKTCRFTPAADAAAP
jgi:hypothetical protein